MGNERFEGRREARMRVSLCKRERGLVSEGEREESEKDINRKFWVNRFEFYEVF